MINTVVDLAVLNLLIFSTHTGHSGWLYAVFKTISFTCAVLNSYLMNRAWTFERVPGKHHLIEGGQFFFISFVGAVVNVASSWWVVSYTRPPVGWVKVWPTIGALVGTVVTLGFNFIGYKFWVFSPTGSKNG